MPALVKSNVGSARGTTEEEGTGSCGASETMWTVGERASGHTESVAMLLEILQEGLANARSTPLLALSHDNGRSGGSARVAARECGLKEWMQLRRQTEREIEVGVTQTKSTTSDDFPPSHQHAPDMQQVQIK